MLKAIILLSLAILSGILIGPLTTVSASTWSAPTPVTNDSTLRFSTSTAQDGKGTVYLFWDQNPGINYILTNTSNIARGYWPGSSAYTSGQSNYTPSVVALKNGTLVLFYGSQRVGTPGIYAARYNNGLWTLESQLTTNPTDQNPTATQDNTGKVWVAWTRTENGDVKISFVDTNHNGLWDLNETIAYDTNGNNLYDNAEPVIYGTTPAQGKPLTTDPRIKFIDTNGDGTWESGEFVVYDTNQNALYDPRIKFVDMNGNNVWDPGEPVIYDANSDGTYNSHTGIGYCAGNAPSQDCMIAGAPPANQTLIKTDLSLKFVDPNLDGVWEPGETLVADSNNNGQYDNGEQAIAALFNDSKLKFVGSGSTWVSGNSIVYDSNGNGIYDSKIKFVDSNHNGHWDPGETVVYDIGFTSGFYDLGDTPIFETSPYGDLGSPLSNDPSLRFTDCVNGIDTVCVNGNGGWDQGEAVVYDSNVNGMYEGSLRFVDSNTNGVWDAGETIVYDANHNGLFDAGELVISGTTPPTGTGLKVDPRVKFYDKNRNTLYDPAESVVYDTNLNALYDTGDVAIAGTTPAVGTGITTGLGEPVVAPGSPASGSPLKTDPKVKYVESDGNNLWELGEDVIYDTNSTGVYSAADPVIYSNGTLPAPGVPLSTDPKLEYTDSKANNVWDSGEPVVYDANLNHAFDPGEFVIAGTIPTSGTAVTIVGEPVIAGQTPTPTTALKTDPKVRYVDTNANARWDTGEPVEYDTNGNAVFDSGDIVIAGTPVPAQSTPLRVDEFTIAGQATSANTALTTDSKIKFVDSNNNGVWNPLEVVIYDSDSNGKYTFGKSHNDTIIAGPAPANNTLIKPDSLIKYSESDGTAGWDNGERVLYDSNSNGRFDPGEPIIAVFLAPSLSSTLRSDSHIKYFETGTDTHWDFGESIVNDTNLNGHYDVGEQTIAGPTPLPGTTLLTDSNIKFVDSNGNGVWDRGETVVYDSNNNNVYNAGEYPIVSGLPEGGTPVRTATHVFYKAYNGSWSLEQRLTVQPYNDHVSSLGQTEDGRIWITWSADRGGPSEILYRTTNDGTSWTPETVIGSSSLGDKDPAMVQDRNGTIWVSWSRSLPCSCGQGITSQTDIFYRYSVDNGVTWTPATSLMTTTGSDEIELNMAQFNDRKLYIFYSNLVCDATTCTSNLFYVNSLITMHAVRMNGLTVQTTNLRVGQTLIFKANVSNTGDFNDSLLVKISLNGTIVASNTSLVRTGQTAQVTVNWTAGGLAPGKYVVTANVVNLGCCPGESLANLVDNTMTLPGSVLLRPAGDTNGDCKVNIYDLTLVGGDFGSTLGSVGFNPQADLNGDGKVNITDLTIVGGTFSQTC